MERPFNTIRKKEKYRIDSNFRKEIFVKRHITFPRKKQKNFVKRHILERMIFIANVRKFNDFKDIGHLVAHYERSVANDNYGNPDIDKTKLDLDRTNLAPAREEGQTAYIKKQIEKVMAGRTLRKDAVKMCCWIVDAPASMPEERKPEFFEAVYRFLVDRYGEKSGMGEDVVISAYIHKSETTDHIHFAFLPVVERDGQKTFCAKEAVGKADLESFHKELGEYLEEKKICKKSDILNGKTKRRPDGKAYSVKELKKQRGMERNRWENRTVETERSWRR